MSCSEAVPDQRVVVVVHQRAGMECDAGVEQCLAE
jgi:hypothetical protein